MLGGAGEAAEGLGTWIKDKLTGGDEGAVEGLKQAMADLNSAMEEGKKTIEATAKNIGVCIYDSIAEGVTTDKMNTLGETILRDIEAGTTVSEGDLDAKLESIGTTAADKFKAETTWKPAGEDAIKSVQSGVKSQQGTLTDATSTVMDAVIAQIKARDWSGAGSTAAGLIKTAFTSQPWSSVGSNIVSGIAAGAKASMSVLTLTMQAIAKAALDAAKKALGIASPSKVMKDKIGQWIPKGIAEGIKTNKKYVEKAMDEVADTLEKTASGKLAEVQKKTFKELAETAVSAYEESTAAATDELSGKKKKKNQKSNTGEVIDKILKSENKLVQDTTSTGDTTTTTTGTDEKSMEKLIDRVAKAVKEGLEDGFKDADIDLYMDGQKVSDIVSKYLSKSLNGKRYATV